MRNRRYTMNKQESLEGKNVWKTFKRLMKYISPYKFILTMAIILSIVGNIFEVVCPYIMGNATNYVVEGFQTGGNFLWSEFSRYIYLLIFLYILSYISEIARRLFCNRINVGVSYTLRDEISKKLKRLPISYFDKNQVGDILSRMTNDVQAITDSVTMLINEFLKAIVIIIGITVVMFFINPSLTIITLLVVPLTIFVSFGVVTRSQKEFSIQWNDLGDLNGHIEEMFSSNKLVKAYNYSDTAIAQFDEKNEKLKVSAAKASFLSGILMPISAFVNNIGVVGVSIVGALFVLEGKINIGNFQSFVQYSRRFTGPITRMTNILSIVQSGIAASERVFELLDEEEEIPDSENAIGTENLRPIVQFKDVSFGYNKDETVIKNLNLDVQEGEAVAIVGPTGSGKTTLVNLLMRFYDVDRGSIEIDGVNIKDIRRADLRNYFGMVLQDTWLFDGTIKENIAYGNMDATDDEIIKAAKMSYSHGFIERLPNGYDTVLSDNASNISEGQKQLLTIARAFISNPKIMILDEATSNVDTRTEKLIQKAMKELVSGRTRFIIAHRLSTIVNADVILVLKDGNIIEKGTHKELLSKKGFYYELYTSQF